MSLPTEEQAGRRLKNLFREWFGQSGVEIRSQVNIDSFRVDFVIDVFGRTFAGEYKRTSDAASVAMAIEQVREATHQKRNLIPLILVPYMGGV